MKSLSRPDLRIVISLALAAVTLAVYFPVAGFEFVYDDGIYIMRNPQVLRGLSPEGVSWAFRTFYASNWHPLTWISHMADISAFGERPAGHHLVNVALHILNSLLLFHLLFRMTGGLWRSGAVAALFALHPLHVESVAWVAERKDLLSTFFELLALGAYVRYVRRGRSPALLGAVTALFAVSLMAKPMPVTFPFLLLLLDVWPLGRLIPPGGGTAGGGRENIRTLAALAVEKAPLFALSAASSLVTYRAQSVTGAVRPGEVLDFGVRVSNAAVSYVTYLLKALWPSKLAVYYPHPGDGLPPWKVAASLLVLLALTMAVLWRPQRRLYLPVGWFWYLGTLVPAVGLVQVGSQALADRYTYLPLTGIFIIVVWGGAELAERTPFRKVLVPLSAAVLAALALTAHRQVQTWQNAFTLFGRALEVESENWLAHNNLGTALLESNRVGEARRHFSEALRLRPESADSLAGLGLVAQKEGRYGEAEAYLGRALSFRPGDSVALQNLGIVMAMKGRPDQALSYFTAALKTAPDDPSLLMNAGLALGEMGRPEEAAASLRRALSIRPGSPEIHYAMGNHYWQNGDGDLAVRHLGEAIRLKGDYVEAMNNLAFMHLQQGRRAAAVGLLERALALRPGDERILRNLEDARAGRPAGP